MTLTIILTAIGIAALSAVVLALISGLFSAAETGLTAASRARMHQLEKDGDKRAARVNKLLDERERLIGSLLLGNNLLNTMAAAITTSLLTAPLGDAGVAEVPPAAESAAGATAGVAPTLPKSCFERLLNPSSSNIA